MSDQCARTTDDLRRPTWLQSSSGRLQLGCARNRFAPMRWDRVRGALTPGEWRTVALMSLVIAGLTVAGFFVLLALVAPGGYTLGSSGAFGVGVGITAYTLGVRHAFDADHIAAIDNTTRRLMGQGQRPLTVGFFFALGHSTIVFL